MCTEVLSIRCSICNSSSSSSSVTDGGDCQRRPPAPTSCSPEFRHCITVSKYSKHGTMGSGTLGIVLYELGWDARYRSDGGSAFAVIGILWLTSRPITSAIVPYVEFRRSYSY